MQTKPKQGPFSWYRRQHPLIKIGIGCPATLVAAFIALFIVALVVTAVSPPKPTSSVASAAPTATTKPTAPPTQAPKPTSAATKVLPPTPTQKPTPAPVSHYPPKTLADLRSLAANGDASAMHGFRSETAGLASCPQPKREITVDTSVTGQRLAEDLLAYFYAQYLDNDCGSIVFAYHDQGEAGDIYTAGRIKLDVNGSKHQLTLDIGGLLSGQEEYVVSY